MAETVVLLHGFAGTGRAWDPVVERLPERYTALAPDLRGHGAATLARPVSFAAVVDDVLGLAPERFALAGYSLGGRVALHVALAAPERVTRLTLVASTAGIEDPGERAERRRADEELAAQLEAAGDLEAFAERWLDQPLFAGDPPEARNRGRREILRNRPEGLAAALRGLGAGVMEPLWDRLPSLEMPVLALAGSRDARYAALAGRLAAAVPDGRAEILEGAGHALPREVPDQVAARLA